MTDWHGGDNPAPRRVVRVRFRDGRTYEGTSKDVLWNHDANDRKNDVVAWERAS